MFKKIFSTWPLFLVSLPLVFLVHYASYYFGLLHWSLILPTLILYFSIPLLIYYLAKRFTRHNRKVALSLLLLLFVFYFFSGIHQLIKDTLPNSPLNRYVVQLPVWLLLLVFVLWKIWKADRPFTGWYYAINSILFLLLVAGLLQYGAQWLGAAEKKNDQADPDKTLQHAYVPCTHCAEPDIYFLLFDGYTNSRTLSSQFGYSNAALDEYLQRRGFYVVNASRSNYNFTHMSIASELNLNYLNRLDTRHRFYTRDFFQSYYTIYHNELIPILRAQGYEVANYSIFPMDGAPVRITPFLEELHYRSVPGQTLFNSLYRDLGWHWPLMAELFGTNSGKRRKVETDLKRINETFSGVVQTARQSHTRPNFVYAHFLMPHETWYFDSLGRRLNTDYTISTAVNPHDYLQQLVYSNKFLIQPLIDSIFQLSSRPFVIVLQGDHGYRNYPENKTDLEFENLQAIYWPGQDYDRLYESQTTVNSFRQVINHLFNKTYPLLPDSSINLMKVFDHR